MRLLNHFRARGLIVLLLAASPLGGYRDPGVDRIADVSRRLDGTIRTIRLLSRRARRLEAARRSRSELHEVAGRVQDWRPPFEVGRRTE
jgi:hypothetical protein